MKPEPPTPPSATRIGLALAGLVAVGASLFFNFQNPFGIWNWIGLAVAVVFLVASRRVR
jgi:hypothetical protein